MYVEGQAAWEGWAGGESVWVTGEKLIGKLNDDALWRPQAQRQPSRQPGSHDRRAAGRPLACRPSAPELVHKKQLGLIPHLHPAPRHSQGR